MSVIRNCAPIVRGRVEQLKDMDFVTVINPVVNSVPATPEVTVNGDVTALDALIDEFVSGTQTVTTSDPGDAPVVDATATGTPGAAIFASTPIVRTALNMVGTWTVQYDLIVKLIGNSTPVPYSYTKTINTPFV